MKKTLFVFSAVLAVSLFADVRNPGFNRLNGNPPSQAEINKWKAAGLVCPDQKNWPHYWFATGTKEGAIEFIRGGFSETSVKLTAPAGIRGYHGLKMEEDLTCEVYLRGHGTLSLLFWNYERVNGKANFVAPAKGITPVYQEIDSDVWTRYTFYLKRPANIWNMHPVFSAYKGIVELDEVRFRHNKHAGFLAIGKAENRLRKEKLFVNNVDFVTVDDAAKAPMEIFGKQEKALADFMKANPGSAAGKDLTAMIESLKPYLFTDGIEKIKHDNWNRMNAISYAVEALTGSKADFPAAAK